ACGLPQCFEELETVEPWKGENEDNHVETLGVDPEERILARRRDRDGVAFALESFLERGGDLLLVFDDQDRVAHRSSPFQRQPSRGRSRVRSSSRHCPSSRPALPVTTTRSPGFNA